MSEPRAMTWSNQTEEQKKKLGTLGFGLPEGLGIYTNRSGRDQQGRPIGEIHGVIGSEGPGIEDAAMGAAMMNFEKMTKNQVDRQARASVKAKERSLGGVPDLGGAELTSDQTIKKVTPGEIAPNDMYQAFDAEGQTRLRGLADNSRDLVHNLYSSDPEASKHIRKYTQQQDLLNDQQEEDLT